MEHAAITAAVALLQHFVAPKISSISGLREDANVITEILMAMNSRLETTDIRSVRDGATKSWLRQVRNLVNDMEDVLEENQRYQKKEWYGKTVDDVTGNSLDIATTMKSLRERATIIRNSYAPSDAVSRRSCSSQDTQLTISSTSINENVGFCAEASNREILESISNVDQLLTVQPTVAIVLGKRGLGKTTLVRSIYNDSTVTGGFDIRAWICVSRSKGRLQILCSILKQFYEANNQSVQVQLSQSNLTQKITLTVEQLKSRKRLSSLIKEFLVEKRYMVVFDDVPIHRLKDVTEIKDQLLSHNNNEERSKLLLTTHDKNVAQACLGSPFDVLYKLKPLNLFEAWNLFCKKAFQSNGGICPESLEKYAWRIVKKCEGVPSAILTMGVLLSTKEEDVVEWRKVYKNPGFYLQSNPHFSIMYRSLTCDYYELPSYLKPCFLYFGLFPIGSPIGKMKAIRLWIAEGFIVQYRSNNLTLEDVAEEYLNELILRNLVEVQDKDPTGRVKTLHIPELLHEIIISMLEEESFCQVLSKNYSTVNEKPRRLSIHEEHRSPEANQVLKSITENRSSTRCLLLFKPAKDIWSKVLTKAFLENVLLLKVLDLSDAPVEEIPDSVGELNLRYLSLRGTRVQKLPSCIGNLEDLQTLDLKQTPIRNLPTELNKLHKLRHLLSYEYESGSSPLIQTVRGVTIPEGVLENFGDQLQKLAFVDVSHSRVIIRQLGYLRQLRRLGIVGLKLVGGIDLCASVEKMKYLQTFTVHSEKKTVKIDLEHLQSPPETLKHLHLNGPLISFPSWMLQLKNLSQIRLRWSNVDDSTPFENLHTLPNLADLQLLEAYTGVHLTFRNEGFKKLKLLHLLDLHTLEHLSIAEGALPLLEELSIGKSPNLQVPSGIKYLGKLKTLTYCNMPQDFTERIRSGEQCYSDIQHELKVFSSIMCENGSEETVSLR